MRLSHLLSCGSEALSGICAVVAIGLILNERKIRKRNEHLNVERNKKS